MRFMSEGGAGMWFVLLFGATALIAAVLFARRPDEAGLGFLRAMSWATAFSMISAFVAGVAASFAGCGRLPPDKRPLWPIFAMKGISESSANVILGSTLLALTWLVIAVGLRRLAARERAGG
jgi:hypothetical protein